MKKSYHPISRSTLAALVVVSFGASPMQAAVLDYIEVGSMYMAYFNLDTGTGEINWTNPGDYQFDGPQVLKPLSQTNPGDYYGGSAPWVELLNPYSQGGEGAASSRLFGFSLSGTFRNYLNSNGYALAIQLQSITFSGEATEAENTHVFYYNRGNDDWGTYHEDKVEWSALTSSNYLIWNGQSFSNMIHLLAATTDPFAADYTFTYTLGVVQNTTGANVNATVVDNVTSIGGITPLTFSYTAESYGAAIPEPSIGYALLLGTGAMAIGRYRRSRSAKA